MRIIIIFLFFLFSFQISGMKNINNIDSLNRIWKNENLSDSIRFIAIQEILRIKNQDLNEIDSNMNPQGKNSNNVILISILTLCIFVISILMYSIIKLKTIKREIERERIDLIQKVEELKERLASGSVSVFEKGKKFSLDKLKIEKSIQNSLGETSWMILNAIFENPSISNKELAEKVSLSVEGVSSSLRRMYGSFKIESKSNKKITLLMKATKISME